MVTFRLIGLALVAVSVTTFPDFRDVRLSVLLLIVLPGLLANLALVLPTRRHRTVGQVVAVVDIGLTFAFTLLVPHAFIPGLLFITGMAPLYLLWLGERMAIGVAGIAALLFTGFGVMTEPTDWIPILAVFVVMLVVLIWATSIITRKLTSSVDRFNDLIDGIDAIVWESTGSDIDRNFLGDRADELLGLCAEQCRLDGYFESRIHPDDREEVVAAHRDVAAGLDTCISYRIIDADDRIRFLHERITVSTQYAGRRSCRGVIIDDTRARIAELSAQSFNDLIERLPLPMLTLRLDDLDDSASLRVMTANPAALDMFRLYDTNPIGRRLLDVIPNGPGPATADEDDLFERLSEVAITGSEYEDSALRLPMSNSVYSLRAVPLPDQCVGVTIDDVTHTARTAEALMHQAKHDDLTGLPNRSQFNERLESAIRACNSATDPTTVAVLMLDLNKFKDVNDNFGHEYGDKLLKEVSRRLTRHIRGCDTISRLGGDEFAVIIRSKDAERSAHDVGARIEQIIGEPFRILDQTVSIGVSIGIAIRSQSLLSARTLLRDADHAMYKAKARGGGIVSHDGSPTLRGTTIRGL